MKYTHYNKLILVVKRFRLNGRDFNRNAELTTIEKSTECIGQYHNNNKTTWLQMDKTSLNTDSPNCLTAN